MVGSYSIHHVPSASASDLFLRVLTWRSSDDPIPAMRALLVKDCWEKKKLLLLFLETSLL